MHLVVRQDTAAVMKIEVTGEGIRGIVRMLEYAAPIESRTSCVPSELIRGCASENLTHGPTLRSKRRDIFAVVLEAWTMKEVDRPRQLRGDLTFCLLLRR